MLSPRFHSSGDLIADRRLERTRDCEAKSDLPGAVDLMRQALEIAARYASAWSRLDAFTVKTHNGSGVILSEKLRYAHGEAHVRSALAAGGLDLLHIEPASIRAENGLTAPGLLIVAASTLPRSRS